jgi:hypothetical protein
MADINRFSEQLVDMAERFADVVDAAQGHGNRKGKVSARWLILPAAGAGVYALVSSGVLTKQARGMLQDAKTRASELPDDLLGRVRQTSSGSSSRRTPARRPAQSAARRSRTTKRRSTASKSAASR